MNQKIMLKLLLTFLILSSVYVMVMNVACSNGAYTDVVGTAGDGTCKLLGWKFLTNACVTATPDFCKGLGLSGELCTSDGGNTGIHCVLPDCDAGLIGGVATKDAANCAAAGFAVGTGVCVTPPTATQCVATTNPFSGIMCKPPSVSHDVACARFANQASCNTALFVWDATTSKCKIAADETDCWRQGMKVQSNPGTGPCQAYGDCPQNDADLFDSTLTGTSKCKPKTLVGCQILGYKLGTDGYCEKHVTDCSAWGDSTLFAFTTGKCKPASDNVKVAACATLGLAAHGTNAECIKAAGDSSCPVNNALLWKKQTGFFCSPVSKLGCDRLGMLYNSTGPKCQVPANDAACPTSNPKLWTQSSTYLRCLPQTDAACLVLGFTLNSAVPAYCDAPTADTNCPINSVYFFKKDTTNGNCYPIQAAACQSFGLKFTAGTINKCDLPTKQEECPTTESKANIWSLDTTTTLRCKALHDKACYHIGLKKSGDFCTLMSQSECNSLLTVDYFDLSTNSKLCLPKSKEACLRHTMIYTDANTPCGAPFNDKTCQLLNAGLKYYETSSPSFDFGCTASDSSQQTKICLQFGHIAGTNRCDIVAVATLDTGYSSDLYKKDSNTYLTYPKDEVKEGCWQYKLSWSANNQFCKAITDASTCKTNQLIWEENYDSKDFSKNSCKGEVTSQCRLPLNSTECSSFGTLYTKEPILRKGSNFYPCITKLSCGDGLFTNDNSCVSTCSSIDGVVSTTKGLSGSTACAKCNTGCKSCTNETTGRGECQNCITGYYLVNTTCTACSIPNCNSCSGANTCTECKYSFQKFTKDSKDQCLSCPDFLPNCKTCKIDDTGKVTSCDSCQDATIISTEDPTKISKCVCNTYKNVQDLRTKINDVANPYIKTLINYQLFSSFYYAIKCQFLEVAPAGCDILIDSTQDLAILNKVLDQLAVLQKQETASLSSIGFTGIYFPSLIQQFVESSLGKAIDLPTIKKVFGLINSVNMTGKVESVVSIINVLLLKVSATTYADLQAELDASINSVNKLMISEAVDIKSDKDTITYEAYVFDKIAPTGEKAGLILDQTGSNSTYFAGKVTDFTQSKTLVSRVNLKKVTRQPATNTTISSEEVHFVFGKAIPVTDANNVTTMPFSTIDDVVIPAKSCITFKVALKTALVPVNKDNKIYLAQWDDTKKLWSVNAVTTSSTANPYVGCASKSLIQPFIVMEAKKSYSHLLALSFGIIASLFLF